MQQLEYEREVYFHGHFIGKPLTCLLQLRDCGPSVGAQCVVTPLDLHQSQFLCEKTFKCLQFFFCEVEQAL